MRASNAGLKCLASTGRIVSVIESVITGVSPAASALISADARFDVIKIRVLRKLITRPSPSLAMPLSKI